MHCTYLWYIVVSRAISRQGCHEYVGGQWVDKNTIGYPGSVDLGFDYDPHWGIVIVGGAAVRSKFATILPFPFIFPALCAEGHERTDDGRLEVY